MPDRICRTLTSIALVFCLAGTVEAQPARPGSLRLVIRDATELAIPGSAVTLTPAAGGQSRTAASDERGEALFEQLLPGDYRVQIESPGFTPADLSGLRVRPGAQTSRNVVLQIAALVEEVQVSPAAEDTELRDAFTETLTPEQLADLPDDPEELAQVLEQLVGGDADIRVNGFAGGRLPAGTQIQDIRVRYDDAAGNGSGGPRIEIRTRPGSGRWRNSVNMNVRDDAMNARNAFSGERPSGQTRQFAWTINGPLVQNRTGISVSVDRAETQEQQTIRAARPEGVFSALVSQPDTRTGIEVEVEHAINSTQELRVDLDFRRSHGRNQGISEFDLPERAVSRFQSDGQIRVGHRATLRRQWINNLRAQYRWQDSTSESASDAVTIRVLDAFTEGGAQVNGGRRSASFDVENELEFAFGQTHQLTFGANVSGSRVSVDEVRNPNGTFTFASLENYNARIPTTYTQRVVNPAGRYALYRFHWYLQENFRVSRSVMINATLRHDVQTRLSDWTNFSPRVSIAWTLPGRKTTLRAGIGVWPQYFDGGLYEQTLWANGQQQRDIVISNPGYPDPFAGGVPLAAQPSSIVRAHPDIVMPYTRRATFGVNQTLSGWGRLRATYSHGVGRHLFRSRDLNAPVDGIRPITGVRNLTQVESTARSLNRSFELDLSLNYRPRRLTANVGYTLGESLNETDGALSLPPDSFNLSHEWGPSRQDVRHRLFASMNMALVGGIRMNTYVRAQSAAPYNITTGLDANGDGQTNERPAGIGRNSGRGEPTANVDLGLVWERGIGRRQAVNTQRGGGGGGRGGRGDGQGTRAGDNAVVRFEVFVRATNVFNLVNPQNFSGVQTSPFFGRATSAAAPRRLVLGSRVHF